MRIITASPAAYAALDAIRRATARGDSARLDTDAWRRIGHPMADTWQHDDGGVIDLADD